MRIVALAVALLVACGGRGRSGSDDDATPAIDAAVIDAAAIDAAPAIDATPIDAALHTLTVAPASTHVEVVDGIAAPATFTARYDGQPVAATWSVAPRFAQPAPAQIDPSGVLTATGDVGGDAIVTASYAGLTATATADVHLTITLNPAGASVADQAALRAATTADATAGWQYPYDGVVFPRGLGAPELMWRGGVVTDLVYAHYVTAQVDVSLFAKSTAPARLALDAASWRALSESGHGGALALTAARLPKGGTAARLVAQTWTIAPGRLPGWIYYFSNTSPLATTVRIAPGAAAADDFFTRAGATSNCVTCHTVSADGNTLIDGGDYHGSTFWLPSNAFTFDITTTGANTRQWGAPAVTPDGAALVQNAAPTPTGGYGIDGLWSSKTGARIANSGLDGLKFDQPSFSLDGRHLVFVDHTSGALARFDFDPAALHASNRTDLLAVGAADPIRRPTYSADGATIFYARGALDTRVGPSDLYALRGGAEVRLAAADGDGTAFDAGARDQHVNYMAYAGPIESGGYQWVVFVSRRTYGNRMTGTAAATKQLWIAAIDPTGTTGDPSHPAFYLTGQSALVRNWDPDWALAVCKADGLPCALGSDCCARACALGTCAAPVAGACAADGDGCGAPSDCCDAGARCANGFCDAPR